jgi:hypothetical protein
MQAIDDLHKKSKIANLKSKIQIRRIKTMTLRTIFTAPGTNTISFIKLSIFAVFTGLFIVFAPAVSAQDGNMYEEPWFPAARFAAAEGGRKEKATITLVNVEKADFETGGEGLKFQICMAVDVRKDGKKIVRRYARTTVFRDDESMEYTLESWKLFKKLPSDCQ